MQMTQHTHTHTEFRCMHIKYENLGWDIYVFIMVIAVQTMRMRKFAGLCLCCEMRAEMCVLTGRSCACACVCVWPRCWPVEYAAIRNYKLFTEPTEAGMRSTWHT